MGGIGKTTLAQKLGQELVPRFPGGVLWLDIGPHATADDLAARLALQLGIDLKDEPTLEGRAARLQNALAARRRFLAIFDDVWDIELGRWLLSKLLPPNRAVAERRLREFRCTEVQRKPPEEQHRAGISLFLFSLNGTTKSLSVPSYLPEDTFQE